MEWLAALAGGAALTALSLETAGAFQRGGYRPALDKRQRKNLLYLCLLSLAWAVLAGAAHALIKWAGADWFGWLAAGLFVFSAAMFVFCTWGKSPQHIKFTPRALRLLCALFLTGTLLCRALIFFASLVSRGAAAWFFALPILPLLVFPALLPALLLALPVERAIAARFICKAKKKLAAMPFLIVIGVTGSYGKTSVKNMIAALLGEQAYATPASFNTPMGICRAINEMPANTKYFVCEMGARRQGDIAQLCGMVRPQVGVITGIAPQHMQTFKTLDAVIKTKGELIEELPCNGIAVFNGYDEHCARMWRACTLRQKFLTGEEGVHARDIIVSSNGSTFDMCVSGSCYPCRLKLIGRHNIENFCLAAQVCLALGKSAAELAAKAENILPVPHRLQLIDAGRGITVLDDGYNSNVRGARAALEALNAFSARRKVVAAQGFAEAGAEDERLNAELGEQIAECADIAVLIGVKAKFLLSGLQKRGFDPQNIYIYPTLAKARELFARLLKEGDVLLIENDLPENL